MILKPNHYYKRSFLQYDDDIIQIDPSGRYFQMLWEIDINNKWCKRNYGEDFNFSVKNMSVPNEVVEYSSHVEMMADMFVEWL